ncbi:MAG: SH3 domain-containing protein [Desulfobacterales bacterium]|nr:SH3 domain-containing protein [Desulfobacterales bacterium]
MKCPICSSDEIYESRVKGTARYLASFSPVIRFRCQNCWNGFWGFRSPLLKAIYLIGACLLAVAAGFQVHSFWNDDLHWNQNGQPPEKVAVIGQPKKAVPSERPDRGSPSKALSASDRQPKGKTASGAAPAQPASAVRAPRGSFELHERPREDAPVIHRVVPDDSLSVIHQEKDWLVVALENGAVGWISEEDFLSSRREKGDPGPTGASKPLPPEKTGSSSKRPPAKVETGSAQEKMRANAPPRPADLPADEAAVQSKPPESGSPVGIKDSPAMLTVSADIGRIRTRPSLESPVLFLVQKNEQMQRIMEKGEWYQVAGGGSVGGWAHKSLFEPGQETEAPPSIIDAKETISPAPASLRPLRNHNRTVAVDVAMVRQEPSAQAPIRFRLYGQEKVEVLSAEKEWLQIRRINGWIGWAHESLFLPAQKEAGGGSVSEWPGSSPTLTVGVDVAMVRTAPSADAPRAFRVVENMQVRLFEQQGDWVRIAMKNGWSGWAHKSLFLEGQQADSGQ